MGKNLITEALGRPAEEKNGCVILIATDVYGIGTNNPDVNLVFE